MMKKYCRNKNFIPESFLQLKRSCISKSNKRVILLLSVLALLLLPNAIKFIFCKSLINNKDCNEKKMFCVENLNDESFYKWMDIIKDDTVGTFSESGATIYIDGVSKFQELLRNKDIIVTNVEELGDKKFKIQINQA